MKLAFLTALLLSMCNVFADYIVPNAAPGNCYTRLTAFEENGFPHFTLSDYEQTALFENGTALATSVSTLAWFEVDLYAKKHPDLDKIYCGFAASNQPGTPFYGESPSPGDLSFMGVGRGFMHIGGFDPLSCNVLGGVCGKNDRGTVYRQDCNKFKIVPNSNGGNPVFLQDFISASSDEDQIGDAGAQPWYSWLTSLMQQIDNGGPTICMVYPELEVSVEGEAAYDVNLCQDTFEDLSIMIGTGQILSNLFEYKIKATLKNSADDILVQRQVNGLNPNTSSIAFFALGFSNSEINQFKLEGEVAEIEVQLFFEGDLYDSATTSIHLTQKPLPLSFDISPTPVGSDNIILLSEGENLELTAIVDGAPQLNWSSSCLNCEFNPGNSSPSIYQHNQNYGLHTLTLEATTSDPEICYETSQKAVKIFDNVQLAINGEIPSYRFKGCDPNESINDMTLELRGSTGAYQEESFETTAIITNLLGNPIEAKTISMTPNQLITLSDFNFSLQSINQVTATKGKITFTTKLTGLDGTLITTTAELNIDNAPQQLDFEVDRESVAPNVYSFVSSEPKQLNLIPSPVTNPGNPSWELQGEGTIQNNNPAKLLFENYGEKTVTYKMESVDDYTCYLPRTKKLTVQGEVELVLYPNPLGNKSRLYLKSNNTIKNIKIQMVTVKGEVLRMIEVDEILANEAFSVIRGSDITNNENNNLIVFVHIFIDGKKYNKEPFKVVKVEM